MQIDTITITATATKSIWLNPAGKPEIVMRHLSGLDTPTAVPRYAVKLRATAAFEKTYSIIRFAPVKNAANSPKNIHTLNCKIVSIGIISSFNFASIN